MAVEAILEAALLFLRLYELFRLGQETYEHVVQAYAVFRMLYDRYVCC